MSDQGRRRPRRWNLSTGTLLLILGLAGLVAFVVFASMFASRAAWWTGFDADPLPSSVTATPVTLYEQEKDLWDWLQLLLVPLVLAIGGFLLTRTENRYAMERQERTEAEGRWLEDQRTKDATLQSYFEQIANLLLQENLLNSSPEAVVRAVARARTLTVLSQLDGPRKSRVCQFLSEAGLIVPIDGKKIVLSLQGAELQQMRLQGANLWGTDLQEANLHGVSLVEAALWEVNLKRARLQEANLQWARLQEANLQQADLSGADLRWANLAQADLTEADLTEAILCDANLWGTNLQRANLQRVDLQGADLQRANLRSANFRGADLTGANFKGAILDGVVLDEAKLDGVTGLPNELKITS